MTETTRRIYPTSLKYQDTHTPVHPLFGDVYFYAQQGIEESQYVYLQGSGFIQSVEKGMPQITVGEIGFGVGLNFVLTAEHFLKHSKADQKLHYVSVEKYPIFEADLRELYSRFPSLMSTAELLLNQYPALTPGFHRISLANGRITLLLLLGDALELFSRLDAQLDHWYWDGCSPKRNPDAFSEDLFRQVIRLSAPHVQGASFTAAGWVRRELETLGFQITKRPGFGVKRECIRATLSPKVSPSTKKSPHAPWFDSRALHLAHPAHDRIAVIGAGLAGTAIASALAKRGFQVTVIDAFGVASRASGNPAGLFNVHLSKLPNPMSRFAQLSLTHFLRELKIRDLPKHLGILRQDETSTEAFEVLEYPENFFEKKEEGVLLPECGIIRPLHLCEARLNHPNIHRLQKKIHHIEKNESSMLLYDEFNQVVIEAEQVVYALGADLLQFQNPFQHALLQSLPFRSIRGQLLEVKPSTASRSLEYTLVKEGYVTPIAPEITGTLCHVLGATYQGKTVLPNQGALDTEKLILEAAKKWAPFRALSEKDVITSLAGYRLSTPDKLPLIGPVCDDHWLKLEYGRALKGTRMQNLPSLQASHREWLFMGMGSRGITFSSLGAEILASLMCGNEPLPIESDLWEHLHASRFFVRNLKKMR